MRCKISGGNCNRYAPSLSLTDTEFSGMLKRDALADRQASRRTAGTAEAGNYVHGMMNRPKYFVEHHWTRGGRR